MKPPRPREERVMSVVFVPEKSVQLRTFKLTIGSTDDFRDIEELMDPEKGGNRSIFEVELDPEHMPSGFATFEDFACTILDGMAFQENWASDDAIAHFEEIE